LINEDQDHQSIGVDLESKFLDSQDERGRQETAELAGRTGKTWKKMNIMLKLTNE
jgi:hypothetical protein